MKSHRTLSGLLSVAAVILVWAPFAMAQDPAKVAPEIYKPIMDNEHVRVLDVRLKPGAMTPMHSHPAYVVYTLSDCRVRFTLGDGKTTDLSLKAGQAAWRDAETHSVENIGDSECHVLNIELKSSAPRQSVAEGASPAGAQMPGEHVVMKPSELHWQSAPPALPAGAQMAVMEGDPGKPGPFTIRFKAPAGYKVPPHWHPADEHLTIISGSLNIGMGDTLDTEKGTKLETGAFAVMPAKMHHFAWSDEETVLQMHGVGPWGINYINPADDPRNKAQKESQ